MKLFATAVLIAALAAPAGAAIIWNEGSNGDLSSNAAAPTPIVLSLGSSELLGTINGNPLDRDYITFTIPAGQLVTHLNLVAFSPDNPAFTALNAGSTSYVPSGTTNANFLAGLHITSADAGFDLLPLFVTRSVTINALSSASLGPGTYCWMIQQTSPLVQNWHVEFVVEAAVATDQSTWGRVKALYR